MANKSSRNADEANSTAFYVVKISLKACIIFIKVYTLFEYTI